MPPDDWHVVSVDALEGISERIASLEQAVGIQSEDRRRRFQDLNLSNMAQWFQTPLGEIPGVSVTSIPAPQVRGRGLRAYRTVHASQDELMCVDGPAVGRKICVTRGRDEVSFPFTCGRTAMALRYKRVETWLEYVGAV